MNAFKRITQIFLFTMLVIGLLGVNVSSVFAKADGCIEYYIVQRGDYLVKIAREYNVTWQYLADINDLEDPTRIYAGQRLCVEASYYQEPGQPSTGTRGQVWAQRVVEDDYATIAGRGLAANTLYDVLFSRYGAANATIYRVGTARSASDGDLQATFDIPSKLVDVQKLSVSLRVSGRIVATNWFYNATATNNNPGGDNDDDDGQDLFLQVIDVVEDEEVTINGRYFPARTSFDVLMADREDSRRRWVEVDTIGTGSSGRFEETFDIPEQLWGAEQIVVLFESEDGKYDASVWFWNRDPEDDVPSFPFLTVVEVIRDEEVTVKFTNLPAGVEYDVMMGEIGTQGIDGYLVGTIRSSSGGTAYKSFPIPSGLRGSYNIAIRMEAPSRGPNAYAYNWFTNRTSP